MSMRDKAERDRLRADYPDEPRKMIWRGVLVELLDIADERDALVNQLAEIIEPPLNENGVFTGSLIDAVKSVQRERDAMKEELTQEQNATWEWQTIAEGMEKRLAEAHKLQEAISRDCNNTALERNDERDRRCTAEAELERLRDSVPGDVEDLINKLDEVACLYGSDFERGKSLIARKDEIETTKAQLLTLIGSLIERKREDLEEAYTAGSLCCGMAIDKAAKAYAERKMKEGE